MQEYAPGQISNARKKDVIRNIIHCYILTPNLMVMVPIRVSHKKPRDRTLMVQIVQQVGEVMLVVGLKEKRNLFLPLEYKAGGEDEPGAVRYSLGWMVIGPVGGQRGSPNCSAHFTRTIESSAVYDRIPYLQDGNACANPTIQGGRLNEQLHDDARARVCTEESNAEVTVQRDADSLFFSKVEC